MSGKNKTSTKEKIMTSAARLFSEKGYDKVMKSEYHFTDEVRELLDQILATAARNICADSESEKFIGETIFYNIVLIFSMITPTGI